MTKQTNDLEHRTHLYLEELKNKLPKAMTFEEAVEKISEGGLTQSVLSEMSNNIFYTENEAKYKNGVVYEDNEEDFSTTIMVDAKEHLAESGKDFLEAFDKQKNPPIWVALAELFF